MRIDSDFPDPISLKKLELKTLEYLRSQPKMGKYFQSLATAADRAYFFLKDRMDETPFSFGGRLELNSKEDKWLFLAEYQISPTKIEVKKKKKKAEKYQHGLLTYSLCIIDCKHDQQLLTRKFHFDYDPEGDRKNIPIFHLQYAGELTPQLKDLGYTNDHMAPWLSVPRLYHHPVTLALLLNLIFKEFYCEKSHSILEDDRWRGIIEENEKNILRPYYTQCSEFLNKRLSPNNLFTNDYCYGTFI